MSTENQLPTVTLLVAAYNEAEIIRAKLKNSYALNYPADLLSILFITDGSNDNSHDLLANLPLVTVMHRPERRGKLAAVNRAMLKINSEIVVLSDANCMLNPQALKNIVRHFTYTRVGAVAGEKRVVSNTESSKGEGLYWRYESILKRMDSELNTTVGAAGELFAFRRTLYSEVPNDTIIEDFALSMDIASRGYKVIYEPSAIASETGSSNMGEEWKRKVRICAGGFQAIGQFSFLLTPSRFNLLSFQFISHRLLRWAVVPFILPVLFILTGMAARLGNMAFQVFFCLQIIAYALAAVGLLFIKGQKMPTLVGIPLQFAMMNAAAYAGLWRYIRGSQSAVWEKSKRAS